MTISRPMRHILGVLSVLLLLTYTGCKSTPEPEPEEEPVVEQPVDETPEEPEAQPEQPVIETPEELAQDDINAARAAVRRANLIGANTFFPSEYRDLLNKLNDGIALGETDPDAARKELAGVIEEANALYDKTLMAQRADYEARYTQGDTALLDIEADKFAPEQYRRTQELAMETVALFEAGDLAASKAKADETLSAQARLHYNLSENIRYVGILKRDTENYIGDAEDNEAFIYAPQELAAANDTYFQGVSAYRNYNLAGSAAVMTDAKRQAVLAARTAAVRKRQSETDMLMTETQRRIEEASRLRTLNEEGQVLEAQPWEGEAYLQSNPLVDHSADVGAIDIEDPELRDLDEPVVNDADGVPEDVPIKEEDTQVNADEQDTDYLAFAKTLWEKGVTARNEGQFDLAQDYFRQAQAYIDVYDANAVLKTYTVVWRQTATDCLWRIAGRDEIFGNPFLWPKIWRANRRIIQNPDLIYPGQVLVIPPK